MPEYVRADGTPAVEPVTPLGFPPGKGTDSQGQLVTLKATGTGGDGGGSVDLGPLNSKLGTLLVQQQVIMNQQAKIMSFFGIL